MYGYEYMLRELKIKLGGLNRLNVVGKVVDEEDMRRIEEINKYMDSMVVNCFMDHVCDEGCVNCEGCRVCMGDDDEK